MSSGEERLEEMLKAVMETENAAIPDENELGIMDQESEIPEIPDEMPGFEIPEISDEMPGSEIPEISDEMPGSEIPEISDEMPGFEIPEIPDEMPGSEIPEISNEMPGFEMPEIMDEISGSGMPEMSDAIPGAGTDEMLVDPLTLLEMSEEEIDKVLEKEAAGSRTVPEKSEFEMLEDGILDLLEEPEGIPDILEKDFTMPNMPKQMADEGLVEESPFGNMDMDLDADGIEDLLELTSDAGEDSLDDIEERPARNAKAGRKKREKRAKRAKKEKKPAAGGKEKKEGLGKKLAAIFFGSDEDELDDESLESGNVVVAERKQNAGKGKSAKADKKDKKKKEKVKKKKPAKKNEPDPKKAAKEKLKREKNAEKAKKKAEKAAQAEKERRAAKKLPKKKVIVWVLFCASIAAGILLMNSIGMDTIHLTEARNAFEEKDFETVYRLLNGKELAEEDQLLFRQSSAVLHLKYAEEAYENHLKLEKPVMALEDLLKGVGKYQELLNTGQNDLITPEARAQYQSILKILQEKYSLSEEGALEVNALDSDYEYSMQLEALVNGETYQSQSEIEQQEEEAAQAYPDLEDILPEEEEYLNDSSD